MKHIAAQALWPEFSGRCQVIAPISSSAIIRGAATRVVEIGPGLGALTEPLLQRLDHLHVVEIDRDLDRPPAQAASRRRAK
jgi:16S rRNA (adenine1518-N6/adenine1519-N6)-dimethyltransferase